MTMGGRLGDGPPELFARARARGPRCYSRRMRKLALLLLAAACAPANYNYSFDLTNSGARNIQKPGERDVLEDADVHSELLVDPTSFQAVLLELTNKTDQPLAVGWEQISIVGPDHRQQPLKPDAPMPPTVEPGAKLMARLTPFSLPPAGADARRYDNADFELVVPLTIRNAPSERRYNLRAHLTKL
jgi:hypothetical protein